MKTKSLQKKLNSLETEAEVIEFLKSSGIEVNSAEELKTLIQPESKELDADELNQAAGGTGFLCVLVGLGFARQWCSQQGKGPAHPSGDGGAVCLFLGAGIGFGASDL